MGSLKKIISVVNFWFFERREVVLLYVIVVVFVLGFELDLDGVVVLFEFEGFCEVGCLRLVNFFGVVICIVLLLFGIDVCLVVDLVGDVIIVVGVVGFWFFVDVLVVSGGLFGGIFVDLFFIFVFVVLLMLVILVLIFVLVLLLKEGEVEGGGIYRNCVINSVKRGNSKVVIWK